MLPLGLFRNPNFTGAQIAASAISATFFAIFLYVTLYLQQVLGLSAIEAGLVYLPAHDRDVRRLRRHERRWARRSPPRVMIAGGLALVAVGMALMTLAGVDSSWTVLLPGFLVAAFGTGLFNPAVTAVALGSAPVEQSGLAAGVNDTFRQAGIAVGVAAPRRARARRGGARRRLGGRVRRRPARRAVGRRRRWRWPARSPRPSSSAAPRRARRRRWMCPRRRWQRRRAGSAWWSPARGACRRCGRGLRTRRGPRPRAAGVALRSSRSLALPAGLELLIEGGPGWVATPPARRLRPPGGVGDGVRSAYRYKSDPATAVRAPRPRWVPTRCGLPSMGSRTRSQLGPALRAERHRAALRAALGGQSDPVTTRSERHRSTRR